MVLRSWMLLSQPLRDHDVEVGCGDGQDICLENFAPCSCRWWGFGVGLSPFLATQPLRRSCYSRNQGPMITAAAGPQPNLSTPMGRKLMGEGGPKEPQASHSSNYSRCVWITGILDEIAKYNLYPNSSRIFRCHASCAATWVLVLYQGHLGVAIGFCAVRGSTDWCLLPFFVPIDCSSHWQFDLKCWLANRPVVDTSSIKVRIGLHRRQSALAISTEDDSAACYRASRRSSLPGSPSVAHHNLPKIPLEQFPPRTHL